MVETKQEAGVLERKRDVKSGLDSDQEQRLPDVGVGFYFDIAD